MKKPFKIAMFYLSLFTLTGVSDQQHDLYRKNNRKLSELAVILTGYLKSINTQTPVHRDTKKRVVWHLMLC